MSSKTATLGYHCAISYTIPFLVSNVPTYGENTVAEFTFALLLALSRKIYPAVKRIREEAWFSCDELQGFDLMGKTLGVIGTGHIGTYTIKIASGFGMHVVAYDPYPKAELAKVYNFEYVDLEELLKQADVIFAPLGYYCGRDKINQSPKLKVIASNTTGHPHIDIDYAAQKGIQVITLKGHDEFLNTITPTAELTWGLIISLTRKVKFPSRSAF